MNGNELKQLIILSPNEWHRVFYDEYKNYVYTIVFNRLWGFACREDIEECISDVFSDIFLYTDRLFEMDDLRGIVGLIAKRKAVLYYRRLSARPGINDSLDNVSDHLNIAERTEERELTQIVMDRIAALGKPDSSIILMSYYYGMTSNQIGKKLGMTSFTVRKRRGRAMKKLKEQLAEAGICGKD